MSYFLVNDEVILEEDEISSHLLQLEKLNARNYGSELVALFLGPKGSSENEVVIIVQKVSGKWEIVFPNEKTNIEGLFMHKMQVLHRHGILYPWKPLTEEDKSSVEDLFSYYSVNPIDVNILERFGVPIMTTTNPNDFSIEQLLPFRYTFASISNFLVERIKTELSQKFGVDFVTYPVNDENIFWFYNELKNLSPLPMIGEKMAHAKLFDLIIALGNSSFLTNFTSQMADYVAESGNLEMMKYMESKGILPTAEGINNAGYSGNYELIIYLAEKGFPITQRTANIIFSSVNVKTLNAILDSKYWGRMKASINAINSIIMDGNLEMLIYLLDRHLVDESVTYEMMLRSAIMNQQFNVARFLMKRYGLEPPCDLLKKIVFGEYE